MYFGKNDQNNVNPENGNKRHISGNERHERHAKILKGISSELIYFSKM